jgi:hypothetical protein
MAINFRKNESISLRQRVIAYFLLFTLAVSFLPGFIFHQHDVPNSLHCHGSIEFLEIITDHTEISNSCENHDSHLGKALESCELCDFITKGKKFDYTAFDLNMADFGYSFMEIPIYFLPDQNLPLFNYNKGSPLC